MQLESLPNELIFHLFKLLDTNHLLRAFFGLNTRFDGLLYGLMRTHQISFQSISKDDFDIICQHHLPLIIDRIISFRLSNEETPNLSELLLSRGFSLNRFICLQTLSLHYIHSLDTLIKITYQCSYLPYLTHLIIIKCNVNEKQLRIFDLFNNIWNLPKLTHCNLNGIHLKQTSLSKMIVVSSSIEQLFIENIPCDLDCLFHLFKCTPRLQELSTTVYSYSINENPIFIIPSITSLKIFVQGSIDSMKNIFLHTVNLTQLTVETFDMYLDGHAWKQIINDYLPKIKTFQLKMQFELPENDDDDIEEKIDQFLSTFRSSFWIEERQWYVRCHWESSEINTRVIVYTLPFAFNTIHYLIECHSKSTCMNEEEYWPCNRVRIFENNYRKSLMFHKFSLICTRFPNLSCLNMILPFHDDIFAQNVMLNRLTSLSVTILNMSVYWHLQTLFDQAPHLYSMRFISAQRLSIKLFQLTSKSIRRIDFIGKQINWRNRFTKEECIAFTDSALGRQCEVLSIEIEDRNSIIDLIQRMSNLRLLNFRCIDDRWDYRKISSAEYELVHWIQKYFPSTYTVIINPEKSSCIQVWIDQQEKLLKREHKVTQLLTSIQRFFSRKTKHDQAVQNDFI